jgi:carboxylesterase type B
MMGGCAPLETKVREEKESAWADYCGTNSGTEDRNDDQDKSRPMPLAYSQSPCQAQFEDLLKAFGISVSLSSEEKLKKLRALPDNELAAKILSMENHTFRAGTDDDFIPSNFLASIHDGSFTDLLSRHDIRVLLGEVADEEMLYRLVNPASSYSTTITQLNNYYPTNVTNSLLKIYPLPSSSVSKSEWRASWGLVLE